jgi:ferritin-like metal-binding protein YciE
MYLDTLQDVLNDQLRDLLNAEKQLVKALPKMAKASSSADLRKAIENHLEETQGHVERLTEIFELLGESPKGKTCKAMEGLIEEGKEIIEDKSEGAPAAVDAALIAAAQRVEHYEISAYGSARAFAEQLGLTQVAKLLQKTLDEESEANETLTEVAKSVNSAATTDASDDQEEAGPAARKMSKSSLSHQRQSSGSQTRTNQRPSARR